MKTLEEVSNIITDEQEYQLGHQRLTEKPENRTERVKNRTEPRPIFCPFSKTEPNRNRNYKPRLTEKGDIF